VLAPPIFARHERQPFLQTKNIFKPGEVTMKQRHLLKLGYLVALILVAASLIYVACDTKKPTSGESQTEGAIAFLNKSTSYTIETVKPELRKLLAYLKRNPQTITPAVLAKAAERHGQGRSENERRSSYHFNISFN
jgi:hypothetical protein